MSRLEANRKILDVVRSYVEAYPNMRFGQALYNLDIATHLQTGVIKTEVEPTDEYPLGVKLVPRHIDIFYEESDEMLKRITHGPDSGESDSTI